jgi:hypothetical protein
MADGCPVVVSGSNQISIYNATRKNWDAITGRAIDSSCGPDSIWIIGTNKKPFLWDAS